jgi:integrase
MIAFRLDGNFVGTQMGKLTAAAVRELRTKGRYGDGDGLLLDVQSPERRYWTFRFMLGGRPRTMTFGSADKVSLTQARAAAARARGMVKSGIDPLAEKDRLKTERRAAAEQAARQVSFEDAALAYIDAHRAAWRRRGEPLWRGSLAMHVFPVFGAKPVAEVRVDDVLAALSPIWVTRTVTATIVRGRIELVLDYAKARGWRAGENPAVWRGNLRSLLPPPAKLHRVEHRPALDWREAPALMAQLNSETSMAAQCLRFVMLTAVRSGEARGARWAELDLEQRIWTIPAARMKAGKEHRVPLSAPAMSIVRNLDQLRTGALVFWGRHGVMNDTTLTKTLRRAGYRDCTVHGMRSCFRDWCADTGKPGELAEAALAHVTGSAVERAYRRSDVIERRQLLMQQWGEFLTRAPAEIIRLHRMGEPR